MNGNGMQLTKRSPIVRFLLKVQVNPITGCWLWQGSKSGNGRGGGYGRFTVSGQTVAAHRWSYATFTGRIIKGRHIDHLCANRACVNPDHLEQVSCKVNQQRRSRRNKS